MELLAVNANSDFVPVKNESFSVVQDDPLDHDSAYQHMIRSSTPQQEQQTKKRGKEGIKSGTTEDPIPPHFLSEFRCFQCQFVAGTRMEVLTHIQSEHDKSKPVGNETLKPVKKGTVNRADHVTTKPVNSGTVKVVHIGTRKPVNDGTVKVVNIGTRKPVNDGTPNPVKNGTLNPVNPRTSHPVQNGTTKPDPIMPANFKSNFQCFQCQFVADTKDEVLKHIQALHGPSKPIANKTLEPVNRETLNAVNNVTAKPVHNETPKPNNHGQEQIMPLNTHKTIKCAACDFIISSKEELPELVKHIRLVHKKNGPDKVQLKMNTNINTTKFKCSKCDFWSDSRYQHIKHEKRYHHSSSIKSLEKSMEQEKQAVLYKCDLCFFSGSGKETVVHHFKSEHPNSPVVIRKEHHYERETDQRHQAQVHKQFKCPECPHSVTKRASLQMHKLCHIQKNKYQCMFCSFSPTSLYSMSVHNRFAHDSQTDTQGFFYSERTIQEQQQVGEIKSVEAPEMGCSAEDTTNDPLAMDVEYKN